MTENKMTLPVKFLTHCKDGNGSVAFVKALLYLDMNALSLFDESAKSPSTYTGIIKIYKISPL